MKTFFNEFKAFAVKGNVIDMAVGVIIGTAFGKIVTSLVNDVIMPVIGVIIGGLNFQGFSLTVGDAKITYGNFIQSVVDFTIVALCIFVAIKMMGKLLRQEVKKEKKKEEKKDREELMVLREIRDALVVSKKKQTK